MSASSASLPLENPELVKQLNNLHRHIFERDDVAIKLNNLFIFISKWLENQKSIPEIISVYSMLKKKLKPIKLDIQYQRAILPGCVVNTKGSIIMGHLYSKNLSQFLGESIKTLAQLHIILKIATEDQKFDHEATRDFMHTTSCNFYSNASPKITYDTLLDESQGLDVKEQKIRDLRNYLQHIYAKQIAKLPSFDETKTGYEKLIIENIISIPTIHKKPVLPSPVHTAMSFTVLRMKLAASFLQ
jgi:hypothetical protein